MDIGGDKPIPYLPLPREENPALGMRGLRASLWDPELLRTQLRAILRVQPVGQCRVLLPMVTDVEDLQDRARDHRGVREGDGRGDAARRRDDRDAGLGAAGRAARAPRPTTFPSAPTTCRSTRSRSIAGTPSSRAAWMRCTRRCCA